VQQIVITRDVVASTCPISSGIIYLGILERPVAFGMADSQGNGSSSNENGTGNNSSSSNIDDCRDAAACAQHLASLQQQPWVLAGNGLDGHAAVLAACSSGRLPAALHHTMLADGSAEFIEFERPSQTQLQQQVEGLAARLQSCKASGSGSVSSSRGLPMIVAPVLWFRFAPGQNTSEGGVAEPGTAAAAAAAAAVTAVAGMAAPPERHVVEPDVPCEEMHALHTTAPEAALALRQAALHGRDGVLGVTLRAPRAASVLLVTLVSSEDIRPDFNASRGGCNIDSQLVLLRGQALEDVPLPALSALALHPRRVAFE
jgi:hypothetical protein